MFHVVIVIIRLENCNSRYFIVLNSLREVFPSRVILIISSIPFPYTQNHVLKHHFSIKYQICNFTPEGADLSFFTDKSKLNFSRVTYLQQYEDIPIATLSNPLYVVKFLKKSLCTSISSNEVY